MTLTIPMCLAIACGFSLAITHAMYEVGAMMDKRHLDAALHSIVSVAAAAYTIRLIAGHLRP